MITQAELKKYVSYDKESGIFTRLMSTSHNTNIGDVAGSLHENGYLSFGLLAKVAYNHRLAWLYEYGHYPKKIDHKNHNKLDNRIENLRDVSQQDNTKNSSKRVDNTSGQVGVVWNKNAKKWQGYIQLDGKRVNLGSFIEFHEAVNARKNAEVLYGYHKNHGNSKGDYNE